MKTDASSLSASVETFDPTLPIARAWMPPSEWYAGKGFEALDAAIVRGTWQPVARKDQLAKSGQYVSGCLVGQPWVLVRTEAGGLKAFHNTCRHKGREVVTGTGQGESLVCGYHGWKYSLDGGLKSAPRMAGIEDFDREVMSLPEMPVAEFGPWVFINLDGKADSFADQFAQLDELLAKSQWDNLVYKDQVTWEIGCNWKVYVDNYLDGGYHIPHMHPTLDDQVDMDTYRTEVFKRFSVQTTGVGEGSEKLEVSASDRIGSGAIYAWMYPNFMINRYGPCLDSNWVIPVGPNKCRVHYEFYFDPSVMDDDDFIRKSIDQAAVTQKEDIEICESVQVGLGSEHYDRGRYAPRVEIGEFHFHQLLHADYSTILSAPNPATPE
jgi:choline monooxygenase